MIEIMDKINNHFIKSVEFNTFEIGTNTITGSFQETYLPGMYVIIRGSYLNDGIYKITNATDTVITVEETLTEENTDDEFRLYASSPPKDFLDLATEIENYTETGLGANSESIDDYSISYGDGDGSWESVFKNKLNTYRRVYTDLRVSTKYKWQNRL
jgi:hypothetical protein